MLLTPITFTPSSTPTFTPDGPGSVALACPGPQGVEWLVGAHPRRVVTATSFAEVRPALAEIAAGVAAGLTAVGFLAYEAAPAFDPAFVVHPAIDLPLLWFALYDALARVPALTPPPTQCILSPWTLSQAPDAYAAAIARIKSAIAAGATYQVNYTLRLTADWTGDPWAHFTAWTRAHPMPYAAYLDLGAHVIASASPELFFHQAGDRITCRPMKGTAPRGTTSADDRRQAETLRASPKEQAENVMIVDMLRNDLGRLAIPGSVQVPALYAVERYETVWQLTSTVEADVPHDVPAILEALFPCASITGAPKVETMRIIRALEETPRGIYCGTIGVWAPERRAQFNVAIRTIHFARATGTATYGTGGGIVWDATAEAEYAECRTKSRALTIPPPFALLETLRWAPDTGYCLLEGHLARLADSADYFGVPLDLVAVRAHLALAVAALPPRAHRVRLLVARDGEISVESYLLTPVSPHRRWRVGLAPAPIDPADRFLYHKTTHRAVYDNAVAACPGVDDVLLWNPRGELTESTRANLVLRLDGALLTPPVESGLLNGVLRAHHLATGKVREAVLTKADLARADAIFLLNSVRGWIPVELV
jgi:para-aminobenzoate synthetase/4-amino-4-deoxychorismate lyase